MGLLFIPVPLMSYLYLVLPSPSMLTKCSLSKEFPHQNSAYLLNPRRVPNVLSPTASQIFVL
jgi:hypothetical protein